MSYSTGIQPSEAMRRMGARELFPYLRQKLLDSRPVVGEDDKGQPIYGEPTFRNRIEYVRDADDKLLLVGGQPVEVHV